MTGIRFLYDSAASFRFAALFTENQTAQLVAQTFRLFGIARGAKTFGKLEKTPSLSVSALRCPTQ